MSTSDAGQVAVVAAPDGGAGDVEPFVWRSPLEVPIVLRRALEDTAPGCRNRRSRA